MFERYTEKARRAVFFARREASELGGAYIETEHLLLGIVREDKPLVWRLFEGKLAEDVRAEIEAVSLRDKHLPTTADMPVSNECKRVFAYAAEEADTMKDPHIGSEHLLLGLLREKGCFAAQLLQKRDITLEKTREVIRQGGADVESGQAAVAPVWTDHPEIVQDDPTLRVEFYYPEGGPILGSANASVVPRLGEHVSILGREAEVLRVVYRYDPTSPKRLKLKRIEIHLRNLEDKSLDM